MSNSFEDGLDRFAEKLQNMDYEYHADDQFKPNGGEDAGQPEYAREEMADAADFDEAIVNEYCRRLRKANGWDK